MKEQPTKKHTTTIEDSIVAGILLAKGCLVTPKIDSEKNKVVYEIEGDTEEALSEIYSNQPIGALDVLRAIKLTRSAIFNFNLRRQR